MAKADPEKMEKLKSIGKMSNEQVAAIADAVRDKDASWWIDNRNTPKEALIVKTWFDSLGKSQQQTSHPQPTPQQPSQQAGGGNATKQTPTNARFVENMNAAQLDDEISKKQDAIARAQQNMSRNGESAQMQAMREAFPLGVGGSGWTAARTRQRDRMLQSDLERATRFTAAYEQKQRLERELDVLQKARQMVGETGKTQSQLRQEADAKIKATKTDRKWKQTSKEKWEGGSYTPKVISSGDYDIRGSSGLYQMYYKGKQIGQTDNLNKAKWFVDRHEQKTGGSKDAQISADSRFLALDRNSVRSVDENGYLHVKSSHISKATVNPYYGKEIPGWREEGLDPDKIYYGLRDPEELKKSVPTWAGLPLHIEHHIDSAEDPQKLTRVGTVGTEIVWNDPYLDAPLTIWDQHAIDGIEDDSFRELSCAYRYEPDFSPGTWNGRHYDFVMRNIRGNHVALVEEGRAGSDVLVADAKPDTMRKTDVLDIALAVLRLFTESLKYRGEQVREPAKTNSLKQEGLMSRFRKWFGAQDSNEPAPEEKVDLVQAILDLARKDPKTGELRDDVQEDADKVAELKVLVEGLRGKLPPEDLERLISAIGALAEAEEAGDGDPLQKKEEEVENVHADAMRRAGCDAEDPDEARAFAGGVKYGEELEKNPAEREKLDREHESEGIMRAMDACGVDAENPSETKAFAEGVKYGEEAERAKAEAKDADPEGGENAELAKKDEKPAEDEDKDAMINKILAAVPDLTEEQKKKIQDTLGDLAYEPATGDEDLEKKVEGATDRALRKRRFLGATDAARIRAQATKDAMDRMRQIADACRVVRPLVGEMDALGFDSASDVYGYTLEQLGKDPMKYDRKAWRGMVAMLLDGQAAMARDSKPAIHSKPIPDSGPFRFLKNITISG